MKLSLRIFSGLFLAPFMLICAAEDALSDEQAPRKFYCAIADKLYTEGGDEIHSQIEDTERKPTLIEIPVVDRDNLVSDGYSENGSLYWYIRNEAESSSHFTLHGLFDFQAQTLRTAYIQMFWKEDQGRASTGSLNWVCTDVTK